MSVQPGAEDGPVLVLGVNGKVIGVDAGTGAQRWAHEVGGLGPVEIAVGHDRVFAMAIEPAVTCVEYPSGRLLGRAPLPRREPGGRLLVERGRLYVQGGGQVSCLSATDGRLLWHQVFETTSGEYWEIAMGFPDNVRHIDRG